MQREKGVKKNKKSKGNGVRGSAMKTPRDRSCGAPYQRRLTTAGCVGRPLDRMEIDCPAAVAAAGAGLAPHEVDV